MNGLLVYRLAGNSETDCATTGQNVQRFHHTLSNHTRTARHSTVMIADPTQVCAWEYTGIAASITVNPPCEALVARHRR